MEAEGTTAAEPQLQSNSTEPEPIQSVESPCEEMRRRGNEAFTAKNYEEANQLYSKALELEPSNHVLYSNRSAAKLNLGKNEEALQDALEALTIDPTYLKAYQRVISSHRALGNLEDALKASQAAVKLEPKNAWAKGQLKQAQKEWANYLREKPVETVEDWIKLFKTLENPKERMLQLAEFWNSSRPEERLTIFHKFLAIIGGAHFTQAIGSEEFTIEKMVELPMDNYADMERNENWLHFYRSQSPEDKLVTFEKTWEITTDTEKNIIVNDLKHFFLVPVLKEKGVIPAHEDLNEDEDDDDDELEGKEKVPSAEPDSST